MTLAFFLYLYTATSTQISSLYYSHPCNNTYVSNRKDRLRLYLVKDEYWKQCWLDELLFCIQLTYLHNKIQWVETDECRDLRSEHNLNKQGQHTQHGRWKGKTRIRIVSWLFSTDHHSQRSQPLHRRVLMLHHYPIFPSFTFDWFVQEMTTKKTELLKEWQQLHSQ